MDEASYCVFLPEVLHYDMPFLMSGMSFQDIFYRLLSLHRQVQDRRLQDSADTPVPETECCDYNIAEQPYDNLLPAYVSSGEVPHQKVCTFIPLLRIHSGSRILFSASSKICSYCGRISNVVSKTSSAGSLTYSARFGRLTIPDFSK